MTNTLRSASIVLAACLVLAAPAAHAARAAGEPSRTPKQAAPAWRAPSFPSSGVAEIRYRDLPVQRLLHLQRANATRVMKPTQIGLSRAAAVEGTTRPMVALRWIPVGRGGFVARTRVRSPDALALRVGLDVSRIDGRVEMRFGGSDEPRRVVAAMRVEEMRRLRGDDGLFWTPSTDGEAQLIELYRPAGVPAPSAALHAPKLSHLLAASHNGFKIVEKIGESGTCNVDTACRITELGQHYVNAKNAVAHMQYVKDGGTYICTGTLLADTTASTQVPYFYGANHCFADGVPVAADVQRVASTLNTFWNYEATSCGSGISAPRVQLTGGATYLYSDANTDGMLLRLNDAAPSGAYFAAWNAAPLAQSSAVLAIHHPSGDAKKVSSGQHVASDASFNTVGWTSGTTEGGSSGSGLFTLGRDGYELRGGLYGGSASCANDGSISNTANRDYYSRLDVLFPNVRQYLAADPIALNGSAPLIPPSPTTTTATSKGTDPAPRVAPGRPRGGIEQFRRTRLRQR